MFVIFQGGPDPMSHTLDPRTSLYLLCIFYLSIIRILRNPKYVLADASFFIYTASGDSFEFGDGRILIYSSLGVQNSIF